MKSDAMHLKRKKDGDTDPRYGSVAQLLHWLMAILLIFLTGVGLYMVRMTPSFQTIEVYALHKSLGIVALSLAVLRVLWRIVNPPPAHLESDRPGWESVAADIAHKLLYALMILIPLSGWLAHSASSLRFEEYLWFPFPALISPSESLKTLFGTTHYLLTYALVLLLVLHVSAVFRHHFLIKDYTLKRMLPKRYK